MSEPETKVKRRVRKTVDKTDAAELPPTSLSEEAAPSSEAGQVQKKRKRVQKPQTDSAPDSPAQSQASPAPSSPAQPQASPAPSSPAKPQASPAPSSPAKPQEKEKQEVKTEPPPEQPAAQVHRKRKVKEVEPTTSGVDENAMAMMTGNTQSRGTLPVIGATGLKLKKTEIGTKLQNKEKRYIEKEQKSIIAEAKHEKTKQVTSFDSTLISGPIITYDFKSFDLDKINPDPPLYNFADQVRPFFENLKRESIPIDKIKNDLKIDWLSTPETKETEVLEFEKMKELAPSLTKKDANGLLTFDLSGDPTFFQALVSLFENNLMVSIDSFISQCISLITVEYQKQLSFTPLFRSVSELPASTKNPPLQNLASFLFTLLKDRELSMFFLVLARNMLFKKNIFFVDSLLHKSSFCREMSTFFNQIEQLNFVGSVKLSEIEYTFPILSEKIVQRMAFAIKSLKSANSEQVLSEKDHRKELQKAYKLFLKLFINSILKQTNGSLAKFESIWDLFLITSSKGNSRYPGFSLFQSVIEQKRKFVSLKTQKDIATSIGEFLHEGDLGSVLLLVQSQFSSVKALSNSQILKNPRACVQIAYELERLKGLSLTIQPDEILSLYLSTSSQNSS